MSFIYFILGVDLYLVGSGSKAEGAVTMVITLVINLIQILILTLIALSKVRTWIIIIIHVLGYLALILALAFIPGVAALFASTSVVGLGFALALIYYVIFSVATWALIRLRNVAVPIVCYSLTFIQSVYLANEEYKSGSGNDFLIIRPDILVILVIFLLLMSLLLYFENLLHFARSIKKPGSPIKKGLPGIAAISLIILIPAIAAIVIGANIAEYQLRENEKEEAQLKQDELKQKLEELEKQNPQVQPPAGGEPDEGEKFDNPYGDPLAISPENRLLFSVNVDKALSSTTIPLRTVSYSQWDTDMSRYQPNIDAPRRNILNNEIFSVPQNLIQENPMEEYTLDYEFTPDFSNKTLPHLLTVTSGTDEFTTRFNLSTRDDMIVSFDNLSTLQEISLKSVSLSQRDFVYDSDIAADIITDPEVNASLLTAPQDSRIKSLISEINQEYSPENYFDKVEAVSNYLETNFEYDSDVIQEELYYSDFLFDTKAGTSLHFAESMTILLRDQDIPARLVGGYLSYAKEDDPTFYEVYESDKIFWVEVYFPGAGWINFYPVPKQEEQNALEEKSQEQLLNPDGNGQLPDFPDNGEPLELTPEELEQLPQDLQEEYQDLQEELEELEQKEEEQKQDERDFSGLGEIVKILLIALGILIAILLFSYLFIYPVIRFMRIKSLTSKEDPYEHITNVYKVMFNMANHFGANIKSSDSPNEVIQKVKDKFGVELDGLDWAYNRAVLREKLDENDNINTRNAWDKLWSRLYKEDFTLKSLTYLYKFKRIVG